MQRSCDLSFSVLLLCAAKLSCALQHSSVQIREEQLKFEIGRGRWSCLNCHRSPSNRETDSLFSTSDRSSISKGITSTYKMRMYSPKCHCLEPLQKWPWQKLCRRKTLVWTATWRIIRQRVLFPIYIEAQLCTTSQNSACWKQMDRKRELTLNVLKLL